MLFKPNSTTLNHNTSSLCICNIFSPFRAFSCYFPRYISVFWIILLKTLLCKWSFMTLICDFILISHIYVSLDENFCDFTEWNIEYSYEHAEITPWFLLNALHLKWHNCFRLKVRFTERTIFTIKIVLIFEFDQLEGILWIKFYFS